MSKKNTMKTSRYKRLGLALDIGTSVIKGSLINLISSKEIAADSIFNDQKVFGADVITRLGMASSDKGLILLQKKLVDSLNKLIKAITLDAGCTANKIEKIAAVGNSAMYHLLLKIKPDTLAKAPFIPKETRMQKRDALSLGIMAREKATLNFLPNIAGFVGSDILSSILMTKVQKRKNFSVIMDMGTNGELVLGQKDGILVASCACGPAFEARHISCGMAAVKGAIIESRVIEDRIRFATIGDVEPRGLSGSGLIDVIAILLDKGIIDKSGKMKNKEFTLFENAKRKLCLTQDDIRQVQLAKAAFSAGIEIMRRRAGVDLRRIATFFITGTFGEYLNASHAKRIGLIPKEIDLSKVKFLKDGGLQGAKKALLHKDFCSKEINDVLSKCVHIEFYKEKDFQDIYAESMHF